MITKQRIKDLYRLVKQWEAWENLDTDNKPISLSSQMWSDLAFILSAIDTGLIVEAPKPPPVDGTKETFMQMCVRILE